MKPKKCNHKLHIVKEDICYRGPITFYSCKCGKKTDITILR